MLPISFIARVTALRITGSPRRRSAARRWPTTPGSRSSSTLPVSISAQVDAFTRLEAERPRWRPQSAGAILSSISASIVGASGTRSSASARHISAMPSSVDRPYSARNTSIKPGLAEPRIWVTKSAPWAEMAVLAEGARAAFVRFWAISCASSAKLSCWMLSQGVIRLPLCFGAVYQELRVELPCNWGIAQAIDLKKGNKNAD